MQNGAVPDTYRWDTLVPPTATHRSVDTDAPAAPTGDLPSLALGSGGLDRLRTLGEGGMGRVSLVREAALDREVAVKEVKQPTAAAVAGLLHEARMMGGLEHPNIIPVHALGADATGAPLLVMKRVEGWTWEALLGDPAHPGWDAWQGSADPLERNVEVLEEVCQALRFAHQRGVVHRDLKPANVMVGAHGEVYLLDFGVAARVGERATRPAGTPCCMAPEMTGPAVVSPSMDVYLVGSALTWVLTGGPRHGGTGLEEVLEHARRSGPGSFPAGTDTELAELADRACAPDPADRPPSVDAIARALRSWRVHRGAVRLASAAHARLQALERARTTGDAPAAVSAFAEARFGFRQALDQWDHPDARDGLRRTLALGIGRALDQEADLDGASAWIDELAGLGADTTDLRARLESARAAVDARRSVAHEVDVTVGSRERAQAFVLVLVVSALLSAAILGGLVDATTPVGALRLAVGWAAMYAVMFLIGRRWVFANHAARTLAFVVALVSGGVTVNRGAAAWYALPMFWVYGVDLLLCAVPLLVCGVAFASRALAAYGLVTLLGFFAIVALPEHHVLIFGTTMTLGPLTVVGPALRWAR